MRWLLLSLLFASFISRAQESSPDSVRRLNEVIVQAYASDRPQQEVPAAIGVIREAEFNRFSPVSILPAVNMIPGVRIEERSPGSYRLAIRGSSLRSPFGIRNVKFYWNGLPLTDGGGNTYLNLIDFNSIGSMEIIKGPGGSIYGAGTGGVVLLTSPQNQGLTYSLTGGSFGLFRIAAGGSLISTEKFQMNMRLSYQQSDGYRKQTKMNRFVAQVDFKNTISPKSFLSGTILSSQLFYETPGGLTKAQYDADPMQARPATPTLPGAIDQQASIKNNTTYTGLNFDHDWNENFSSRIGMFGSITDFTNPAILNYEKRREENWGGRTENSYSFKSSSIKGKILAGAEYQHFYGPLTDYNNLKGTMGTVQTDDLLRSQLFVGFAQADFDLPHDFYLTLGGSINTIKYDFHHLAPAPEVSQTKNFDPVLSPRIALLKKVTSTVSVYGSISNGFSQPSLAEVLPSGGKFNSDLNSERGTSYEMGIKALLFEHLDINLVAYDFELNETIVNQPVDGKDFFVNAGATSQKGVELGASWFSNFLNSRVSSLRLRANYTFNEYRFNNYIYRGSDYSGNPLTGVAPNTFVGGIDLKLKNGFYINITGNYSNPVPLNYAATEYASDYFLLGTRLGYFFTGKLPLELFAGIDNALDQKYSLGNDLNATGSRYYNAAPGRNYFGGISLRLNTKPAN